MRVYAVRECGEDIAAVLTPKVTEKMKNDKTSVLSEIHGMRKKNLTLVKVCLAYYIA